MSGPSQPGDIQSDDIWDSFWRLHVMAHVHAVREVLPAMLERGDGYLLQTASVVALATIPDKAAYAVTKHAALALAEWLAVTYGSNGIKVSCFCPGPMRTPMLIGKGMAEDDPIFKAAHTPEQVADRLVRAIDDEQFLIVDSALGTDALMGKATDYEGWVAAISAMFDRGGSR